MAAQIPGNLEVQARIPLDNKYWVDNSQLTTLNVGLISQGLLRFSKSDDTLWINLSTGWKKIPFDTTSTLTIGTVVKGQNASATITNNKLNLVLPVGDNGQSIWVAYADNQQGLNASYSISTNTTSIAFIQSITQPSLNSFTSWKKFVGEGSSTSSSIGLKLFNEYTVQSLGRQEIPLLTGATGVVDVLILGTSGYTQPIYHKDYSISNGKLIIDKDAEGNTNNLLVGDKIIGYCYYNATDSGNNSGGNNGSSDDTFSDSFFDI